MSTRFDTSDATDREGGLAAAALAIRRGDLVVVPTDTVYGVGCDAFDADAVTRLLEAKGRGRDMPPPVLVSAVTTLDAITTGVPEWTRVLIDVYWPGPLTVVCTHQRSLQWDLGDTRGTVAVRMPLHDITLDLIQRTGPLAVSSANTWLRAGRCRAPSRPADSPPRIARPPQRGVAIACTSRSRTFASAPAAMASRRANGVSR